MQQAVEPAELVAPLVGLSVDVADSPAPDVVLALPVPTLAPAVDSPPEPVPQPSPQIHKPATNQTRVISDRTTRQFTRQPPLMLIPSLEVAYAAHARAERELLGRLAGSMSADQRAALAAHVRGL